MKKIFGSVLLLISFFANAEIKPGFDKNEVRDMIALCNSYTFLDLYGNDAEIIPSGYKLVYTSPTTGTDNKYQVYTKGDVGVINFRGSTDKQISWMQNMYSSMIPARNRMVINGEKFEYCFARNKNAAVHSGYAMGIGFLHKDIISQINSLNKQGIYNIIITGHSQGGALANMLRAYLGNLMHSQISTKNKFKVYAFAAPMCGNKEFVEEYNSHYAVSNNSYNIINKHDLIPTFPVSFNDTSSVKDYLFNYIGDREDFSFKKLLFDRGASFFEDNLSSLVKRFSNSASQKINKEVGDVDMPAYVEDVNYHRLEKIIELEGFEYPKILKDSSILKNDSLMGLAVYARKDDGTFYDERVYKKAPMFYQHKPYNYYVCILRTYFPADYRALRKKYLPENL